MKKGFQTILDISSTHVKLLQTKLQKGKFVVSSCEVRSLNSFTDAELVKAISEVVLSKNVTSDHFTLSIPRQFVIVKQLKLPSTNDFEIRKMLGLQLVNKIPYALEDVIYDYQVLEKDSSGYTRLLIGVVHKEVTERFLKIFRKIGVHPNRMTLSSVGVCDWLTFQSHKNNKVDISQVFALIDVDSEQTEVCICQNKKLLYSRSIRYGAKDLTEENIIGLLNEIEKTFSTYSKDKMGESISKILIISDVPQVEELRNQIENQLKISTGRLSMFENVLIRKKANVALLKNQSGVSITVALGLLLGYSKNIFNLTPVEVSVTKQSKRRRQELTKFFIFLFIGFSILISMLGVELYYKTIQSNKVQESLENTELRLAKAKKKIDFVNNLKAEFTDRIFMTDIMFQLYEVATDKISFRSVSLDGNRKISIQGYAETQSSVNNFQGQLVRSKIFEEVNLQFATKRKIFNQEITDFKIIARVSSLEGNKND